MFVGICNIDEDDGFTIFCERCSVWQHGACVGIYDAKDAPDKYLCDRCNPRYLDIQKAIRHQRQRQEAEHNNHKPKRRTSNQPKTKPNHQNSSTLGPSPNLPPPQNRKEKHPSPPRRTEGKRPRTTGRGQSATQVETIVQDEVDVVNDEDADLPSWPNADDYDHRDQNEVSPAIGQLLEHRLQLLDTISLDGMFSCCTRLTTDLPSDFERLDSMRDYSHKILRQPVPTSFSNFVRQFGIFAAEPVNENDLIMEFTGRIGTLQDYRNDPINQYSILQRPKQYVLFSPPHTLDIYVDARLYGNKARYVRRSCFPNARVALVCVSNPPERGIHFGLFATKNIKTRDEITIDHDWNLSHKMETMISAIRDETKPILDVYTPELIRSMATYSSTILVNGDCACHDSHCIFTRLRKAVAALPETLSRRTSSEAMSIDGMQRSDDLEGSEMEDDSLPNSRGTTKQPGSRDLSPSKDMTVDIAPKTAREQRKIDQAMARFAQMEEKEKEKSSEKRKKSEDIDDTVTTGTTKRRRQNSISSESTIRPTTQRISSAKGRGVKRKSMSPSPGVDRISESGASVNESPKPGGRVPNRVKRSMKGRKEPSNKKVRLQPPEQDDSTFPKWVKKATLSETWMPPQILWFKKYAENAKREFDQSQECKEPEVQHVVEKHMEEVISTAISQATPPPNNVPPTIKSTPSLRVAMPSTSFHTVSDQTPMNQMPITSAIPSQPSTSYFSMSGSATSGPLPASPIGTPLTPKKLTLADYRARRASGMVTPSTSTDPQSVGEGFAIPPPPLSQGSKSPDQKPAEPPTTS